MPNCPKCGKAIDYLKNYSSCEEVYEVFLNGDELYWEQREMILMLLEDYECPECNEVLFRNSNEALDFLKS